MLANEIYKSISGYQLGENDNGFLKRIEISKVPDKLRYYDIAIHLLISGYKHDKYSKNKVDFYIKYGVKHNFINALIFYIESLLKDPNKENLDKIKHVILHKLESSLKASGYRQEDLIPILYNFKKIYACPDYWSSMNRDADSKGIIIFKNVDLITKILKLSEDIYKQSYNSYFMFEILMVNYKKHYLSLEAFSIIHNWLLISSIDITIKYNYPDIVDLIEEYDLDAEEFSMLLDSHLATNVEGYYFEINKFSEDVYESYIL